MRILNRPRLSIIIPCYNAEKYIDACLLSVCAQSLRRAEILCVDDGSSDATPDRLEEWRRRDSRVRVITQENRGVSAARNRGLSEARGDYVYFLDSDDEAADSAVFEECCELMQRTGADVLVGGARTVYTTEALERQYPEFAGRYRIVHSYAQVMDGHSVIGTLRRNREWWVPPGTKLFRRAFLKKNALSFITGYIHEDGLFTFESLYLAKRVVVTQRDLYVRRIREDSIMTKPVTYINTLGYLMCFIEGLRFFAAHPGEKPRDPIEGATLGLSARLAAKTYAKLDGEQRQAMRRAMTPEQAFYFEALIRGEVRLLCETERLKTEMEENSAAGATLTDSEERHEE